jgi:hypothetical protein
MTDQSTVYLRTRAMAISFYSLHGCLLTRLKLRASPRSTDSADQSYLDDSISTSGSCHMSFGCLMFASSCMCCLCFSTWLPQCQSYITPPRSRSPYMARLDPQIHFKVSCDSRPMAPQHTNLLTAASR